MDTQDIDPEGDAASMAQMMGFTSFGSQAPPSKKRRYNPRADAIAAPGLGAPSSSLPRKPPAPRGTGANTLPIMPRNEVKTQTTDPAANVEGPGGAEAANYVEPSREGDSPAGKEAGHGDRDAKEDQDPEPQYIDASRPPLRSGGPEMVVSHPAPLQGYGQQQQVGRGGHAAKGGPGHFSWWTDYYDPSSNENPWEALEKALGLDPVGAWLPKGHAGRGGQRSG